MTDTPVSHVSAAVIEVCRGVAPKMAGPAGAVFELIAAARHHRVAPLAHVLLRDTHPDLAARLKPDRDAALAIHIRATIVLDDLRRTLGDIPWVSFKGAVLSETAHPVPGLRSYHDVDVLVDPTDLREVSERLLAAGWSVSDYQDMLLNPSTPGEMHWVSPTGLLVDLHWSMINMATRRRRFSVSTAALLDRRVPVTVGTTPAWTLCPADALVHVCLHAALTGANRMLWLLDADQLARQIADWREVATVAHAWGAGPAVAVVLGRAQALLGTPLPPGLFRGLGVSAGFRRLTAVVDRLSPVPALTKDASLSRLMARAARPSTTQTLAVMGRNAALGVRDRLFTAVSAAPNPVREPADAAALQAYLQAVEAETQQQARQQEVSG